jgi:hypothetical protein
MNVVVEFAGCSVVIVVCNHIIKEEANLRDN